MYSTRDTAFRGPRQGAPGGVALPEADPAAEAEAAEEAVAAQDAAALAQVPAPVALQPPVLVVAPQLAGAPRQVAQISLDQWSVFDHVTAPQEDPRW